VLLMKTLTPDEVVSEATACSLRFFEILLIENTAGGRARDDPQMSWWCIFAVAF